MAPDVPSVGYKVFEIINGAGSAFSRMQLLLMQATGTIDNDFFTIALTNDGVITSLIDKTNGNKELVNSGSTGDYINNISLKTSFEGNSNTNGSFLVINNAGAVSLSVKITSTAVVNHETLITVFKEIPRIEIDNKITTEFW